MSKGNGGSAFATGLIAVVIFWILYFIVSGGLYFIESL